MRIYLYTIIYIYINIYIPSQNFKYILKMPNKNCGKKTNSGGCQNALPNFQLPKALQRVFEIPASHHNVPGQESRDGRIFQEMLILKVPKSSHFFWVRFRERKMGWLKLWDGLETQSGSKKMQQSLEDHKWVHPFSNQAKEGPTISISNLDQSGRCA